MYYLKNSMTFFVSQYVYFVKFEIFITMDKFNILKLMQNIAEGIAASGFKV